MELLGSGSLGCVLESKKETEREEHLFTTLSPDPVPEAPIFLPGSRLV